MPPSESQITYYTQHRGDECTERGVIDIDSAAALVKNLVWRPNKLARKPDEAFTPLVGFVDENGTSLEIAPNGDTAYFVHLELPTEKPIGFLKYRRWKWRTASRSTIRDVVGLVKLFFVGRVRVIDDLLKASGPAKLTPTPADMERPTSARITGQKRGQTRQAI